MIRFAICSALALGLMTTHRAHAQDGETRAGAAQLWAEAWALKDAGRATEACEKFFVVQDLYPSASAHIQAGECNEALGKFASAWSAFDAANGMSQREPDEAKRARLRESSRAGIERTASRRSWVTVVLDGEERPASLALSRNGKPVPIGILGEALPSDAGELEFELRAPGYAISTQRITLKEAERAEVHLELERLPDPQPAVAPPLPEPEVPAWAWIVGGTGIAFAAVSVGFVVDEQVAVGNLNAYVERNCGSEPLPDGRLPCDADPPEDELARRDRGIALAIGFGAAGGVAMIASAIGIGLGLDDTSAGSASALPWITPHSAGVAVSGRIP